jgi:hypothetical protein
LLPKEKAEGGETMSRIASTFAVVSTLAILLGGCADVSDYAIDPSEWFAGDWFGNKKKLEGPRKPVFPEGVPGVTKGVPQDLVKGYQPSGEQDASALQGLIPEDPKPKPKPKPKVAAKPKAPPPEQESRPTPVTVRRSDSPQGQQQPAGGQWPDPSPAQSPARQQQPGWPDPPRPGTSSGGVQWPDPPPSR